jgi:dipeptidyl aminopeptidase/acylaminoacyl peptidase
MHSSTRFEGRLARVTVALAFASLSGGMKTARSEDAPSAADFVYSADYTQLAMSPDGRLIAMNRDDGSDEKVAIFEPGQTEPKRILNVADNKVRSLAWADDDTILITMSGVMRLTGTSVNEAASLWTVQRTIAADVGGGSVRILLEDGSMLRSFALPLGQLRTKPDTVVVEAQDYSATDAYVNINTRLRNERRESGFVSTVLEVDTGTGKGRLLERGTAYTQEWLLDAQGVPVARTEWNPDTQEFQLIARSGRSWRSVYRQKGREINGRVLGGITADGKSLVFLAENGGAWVKAWTVPLDASAPPQVLFGEDGKDIDSVLTADDGSTVAGYRTGGLEPADHWTEPARAAQHRTLTKAFPGRDVQIVQRSTDGKRVVASVESRSQPGATYLIDFNTGKADLLGESFGSLAGTKLAESRAITYLARDGASIPAYLLLPAGRKPENLPLVVLPHGGPESRDESGFDWLAQFLATRGYAVLQPQFRGSTGFGRAHRLAGYHEWGGRMQDDVSDGVRHLIANGIANPAKVCIVGASYGGYAALAGAAFTPELYACAAGINGVFDPPSMIGHVSRREGEQGDGLDYWKNHIGSPLDPKVAARSPARAAASIRAPVLLMHAQYDTTVPIAQSEQMARALETAGKKVEFHKLSGEDHGLSFGPTRTEVLERLEDFLAAHL